MRYPGISIPAGTTVLVTGGAGFIGSNICEALLSLGCKVRCLDDLSLGKTENMACFANDPNFSFVKGSITDETICRSAADGVDVVMHQAAWGSVPRSLEMPLFYFKNNVIGTANVLEACRQSGVKRFIYASSSSVYGDATGDIKREGEEGQPLSPYAMSKKCGELIAHQYAENYGIITCGLRYFNVFGRRQDPNGAYAAVIPKFVKSMLSGERPVIYGDGTQSRDFTYVENVVYANLLAASAPEDTAGRVFNIACSDSTSLLRLCEILNSELGTDIEPVFAKARRGDIKNSLADIERAGKALSYRPLFSFVEGLRRTIDWYRDNI